MADGHGAVVIITSRKQWEEKHVEAKTSGKVVVVDFTASWCGPCRVMAPLFQELSEKYSSSIIFLKVDVDEMNDISQEYEIRAMPTFMFFKDGKQIDKLVGANKAELEKKVIVLATNSVQ